MSSLLSTLKPPHGSRSSRKRLGRGIGSGLGKTAGRGQKGQSSRTGKSKGIKRGFEGGQMPLQRRLPKRGFINPFRRDPSIINIRDLARFEAGAVVGPEELLAAKLVPTTRHGVKLLAVGELEHAITIRVHACSMAAMQKVQAAGGTVELLDLGQPRAAGCETD
jgi:large subunit ribosomal protein L15